MIGSGRIQRNSVIPTRDVLQMLLMNVIFGGFRNMISWNEGAANIMPRVIAAKGTSRPWLAHFVPVFLAIDGMVDWVDVGFTTSKYGQSVLVGHRLTWNTWILIPILNLFLCFCLKVRELNCSVRVTQGEENKDTAPSQNQRSHCHWNMSSKAVGRETCILRQLFEEFAQDTLHIMFTAVSDDPSQ